MWFCVVKMSDFMAEMLLKSMLDLTKRTYSKYQYVQHENIKIMFIADLLVIL